MVSKKLCYKSDRCIYLVTEEMRLLRKERYSDDVAMD